MSPYHIIILIIVSYHHLITSWSQMFNLFLWVDTFHPHPATLLLTHPPVSTKKSRYKVVEWTYLKGDSKEMSEVKFASTALQRWQQLCQVLLPKMCLHYQTNPGSIIKCWLIWGKVFQTRKKVRGNVWTWVVIHLISMDCHQVHLFRIRLTRVWSEKITTMIVRNVILIILSRSRFI